MAQTFHGQPLETADHADHAEPSSPTGESTMSSPRSLKTSQVLTPQNDRQSYCFKHQTTTGVKPCEIHQVPSSPHRVSPAESRHLGWPAAQWTKVYVQRGRVVFLSLSAQIGGAPHEASFPGSNRLGSGEKNSCATLWLCQT